MSLSYVFRQSLKRTTRRQRRVYVVLFALWACGALFEAGGHWHWTAVGVFMLPYVSMLSSAQDAHYRRKIGVRIGSLDERAFLRYGVEFDQLTEEQQHFMLGHYRVGNYIWFPKRPTSDDEERLQGEAAARRDAHRMMAWAVVPAATVYAIGWHVLPRGYLRSAWTNWPVVVLVALCVSFCLPRLLWMWREPDELPVTAFTIPDWI